MKYRLAVLASHPVQYQVPLFRKLAQHPQIELVVYYCSDFGVTEKVDPGFGISIKWDIPLLEGYKYRFLRNYAFRPSPSRLSGLINPGIIRELRRERYDAILIHGYALATNWLAFIGAWITQTPIIFRGETFLRSDQSRWRRAIKHIILKPFFQKIEAFLPIGIRSREFYLSYGISEDQMFLTPYSVDNEFFMKQEERWRARRVEVRRELNIPESIPTILCVAKMTQRKRPMDLLKAFEPLKEKAVLAFVGDGELRSMLENYVQDRNIRNIFFLGFKNQSELPKYYVIADTFVLPSSYEPWGLVINEAMCYGLPIITTDGVAASADLVRHGENGFIYPAGDIDTLTDLQQRLLYDSEKRQKMGQRSREIISTWNYDACVDGILKALEYVTQGKG